MTYTVIELAVIAMIEKGEPLHGLARDIAIDTMIDGRL